MSALDDAIELHGLLPVILAASPSEYAKIMEAIPRNAREHFLVPVGWQPWLALARPAYLEVGEGVIFEITFFPEDTGAIRVSAQTIQYDPRDCRFPETCDGQHHCDDEDCDEEDCNYGCECDECEHGGDYCTRHQTYHH